ncbi:MAG: hypothetical protein H6732_14665 [Alphaproteobacteria bacterium]|nr:hypothetical protein [Alphaproteobacteria bacterium]
MAAAASEPAGGVDPTRRGAWVGAVLLCMAVGVGLASLAYPFGRDQGLFQVVGRGWVHGELPYRDLFEQKTPWIFLVHALTYVMFGSNAWGVRVVELLFLLVVGVVGGRTLARWAGVAAPGGFGGLGAFAAVGCYLGLLSFWDTAQCEVWVAGFTILAVAVGRARPQAGWAGLCFGLALLAKPPGLLLLPGVVVAVISGVLAAGGRGGAIARAALVFGLAASVPWVLFLGGFAAVGALDDVMDVLVRANRHYVAHEAGVDSFGGLLVGITDGLWIFGLPLWVGGAATAVQALRSAALRQREPALLAATCTLLVAGAATAVTVQGKFFVYHYGVLLLAGAFALVGAVAWLGRPGGVAASWSAGVLPALGGLAVLHLVAGSPAVVVWSSHVRGVRHLVLDGGREVYCEAFRTVNYDACINEDVGRWLAAHAAPGDRVAVRGFEPAIYTESDLPPATRFFWTAWLTDDRRAYRRRDWRAQDLGQLQADPPRWVVTLARAEEGPDSAGYFGWTPYVERASFGPLTVLERVDEAVPEAP